MRNLLFFSLLVNPAAYADEIVIPVLQSSWAVRFEAPALNKMKEEDGSNKFYYAGNNARLNVSLIVDDPQCPGEVTSHTSALGCFRQTLERAPFPPVSGSLETVRTVRYSLVMYAIRGEMQGQPFGQMNAHYVFAYRGKWCQLHVSVINPRATDLSIFKDLERTFKYGDL